MLAMDINNIFSVSEASFNELSEAVFNHQYQHNKVYKTWVDLIVTQSSKQQIPFSIPMLPISFFKTHKVYSESKAAVKVFESSGTTGAIHSRHYIADLKVYENSFLNGFERVYGSIKDWCILALLPAYLEKNNSSLVYMAEVLIKRTQNAQSNFFLSNFDELAKTLTDLELRGQKTILLGVSFALLDFVKKYPQQLKHTIVMETGGMKGRGRELIKQELYSILQNGFGVLNIHSEYGMTELMSQAYSTGDGRYYCPPWMRVFVVKEDDPLTISKEGIGLLQVMDLANFNSCSFIATQDIGKVYTDGSFEVLGRMDHSDLRGCSLMVV